MFYLALFLKKSAFLFLPPAVDKMIRERGDLFSDTQCIVCSAVLISQSQKLTHYQVSAPKSLLLFKHWGTLCTFESVVKMGLYGSSIIRCLIVNSFKQVTC